MRRLRGKFKVEAVLPSWLGVTGETVAMMGVVAAKESHRGIWLFPAPDFLISLFVVFRKDCGEFLPPWPSQGGRLQGVRLVRNCGDLNGAWLKGSAG